MLKISEVFLIYIQLFVLQSTRICMGQQTHIVLEQGSLMGIKIFPDSSRTAVYAFLGIPYAQPPTGDLRFAAPQPHAGWNGSLQAKSMRAICPQLSNTIYDETPDRTILRPVVTDEDCLYLNIWVPESGMRYGKLPVLVIITGEEMSYDWPRNRATGLDFASEGVVVVSVQYRSNIFGWINLDNNELPGNYGLQDLEFALNWIQRSIEHFGGNADQVTLLGHGTSGAPCAMALAFDHAKFKEKLFSKLILMSGGNFENFLNSKSLVIRASNALVQKLGCHFDDRTNQIAACLRMKSVSDLLKAFESVYDHGNGTLSLGPVLSENIKTLLTNRTLNSPLSPILIGITSNEGAFLQDYWLDLARESYQALRTYVNFTVLPNIFGKFNINSGASQIVDALNWRYFSGEAAVNVGHLLNAMQRLISESIYETPFYQMLELLSTNDISSANSAGTAIYAYIFDVANSMDMRGKVNLFGGASHSSDLPLLLGPSLFQQISRRRFTADEEKTCRKIRSAFINFVKSDNPTPGRVSESWLPYTKEQKFIFNIGETVDTGTGKSTISSTVFEKNLPQIEKLLENDKMTGVGLSRPNRNDYNNPYQVTIGQSGVDGRPIQSTSLYMNQQDSGYALHLKRVYGFWHVLIPNMAAYSGDNFEGISDAFSQRARLMEATADAARYKHGFFAMLTLVSVLLAILGLCVYLLRRDPLRMSSHSSSRFCL